MDTFWAKLKSWNTAWNDLPRRLLIVLLTCAGLALAFAAFRYLAPLVCALCFSWIIRPLAKPMEALFRKIHVPQKLAALLATVVVFGVLIALIVVVISALTDEAVTLLDSLPTFVEDVTKYFSDKANHAADLIQDRVGDRALQAIYNLLLTGLDRLAGLASDFAGSLVSFTWSAVTSLPDILLFVLFTVMESYYLVADRHVIANFFRRQFPEKVSDGASDLKEVIVKGIRAQFYTALLEMLAAAVILFLGFLALRMDYSLMFAILISVLDALPVIGAGLIMFPMAAYYLVTAEYVTAVGVLALYLIVQVMKRIMEPKIMGKQMKLNQLATMICMYAGYRFMGYLGLLIGPLMLMLFTAILGSTAQPTIPVTEAKPHARKGRRRK